MRFKLELKWGIIFTITALLWMIFEKAMGWHGTKIELHAIYTNFFAILAILIYVLAYRDKRKNGSGPMQWKHGFFFGLGIAVVVTLLNPLSQWIISTLISPEYFPNAINYAVENGKLSQEEAEAYFNIKNYIIQGTFGGLIMGAVTGAIVALFIQKRHPEMLG